MADSSAVNSETEVVRCFIALAINDEVRRALSRCQERLKCAGGHVSWTKPDGIHLTLAFLGEVVAKRLARLQVALDRVAFGVPPFSFEVGGLGTFGPRRAPRVIWAGIREESGMLAQLHEGVTDALESLGFEVERRAFKPHLTVGRVRSARSVSELTSALGSDKNSPHGWVQVEQLLLMRSQLEPQGARYSVLHSSRLEGTDTNGHESV